MSSRPPLVPPATQGGGTASAAPTRTFLGSLELTALERPDERALVGTDASRTWHELRERSVRVANGLRAAGVGPGDRVAFLGRNSLEYFDVLYGVARAGAVLTALNWRLSPREVDTLVEHSDAKVVVVDQGLLDLLLAARPGLRGIPTTLVYGPSASTGQGRPADPDRDLPGAAPFDVWLDEQSSEDVLPVVRPDDLATHTYTSGTTGRPKGVVHSFASLHASLERASLLEISADTVFLVATPLFHANAASGALTVLHAGGTCVVAPEAHPAVLLDLIERHRVTHSALVPTVIDNLVRSPELAARDTSSLRTLVYAGSPMPPGLLDRTREALPAVRLIQVYGATETIGMTVLTHEDHEHHAHTAGRPMPGVTLRLVDPVTGVDITDAGLPGEVQVQSPTAMAGYWQRPDATASTITQDGYIRTGDIGVLDGGYLTLVDRLDDMIITGGENVYPAEVENVLIDHPDVAEVAVVGVPSEKWGESVLATVVLVPGRTGAVTAAELIAFARARLAAYKCPTSVRFADELPRNATGKVLRSALRASARS
ncbi:long-chain-fatty-acid--CoA ligase [Nocardioides zeae]|uniref:Long-chain-fatty-acid--CoA ligase n=1 Tax=Nocardioides zeae TaxID=1457234 RepID=A0A6P0HM95_9ACTN|nr:long-chain-fatty-acid--CoA ligase [Nocardioides zeae]NEN79716.1 long-chain-fatty-acid--CoA ligase [Nocardioides zeae]